MDPDWLRQRFEKKLDFMINERHRQNMNSSIDHIKDVKHHSFVDQFEKLFDDFNLVFELFKYYDLPQTHLRYPNWGTKPWDMSYKKTRWETTERIFYNTTLPKNQELKSLYEFESILNILYCLRYSRLFNNPVYTNIVFLGEDKVKLDIDDIFANICIDKKLSRSEEIERRLKNCDNNKLKFMFNREYINEKNFYF